jgi:hypothetical protein
MIMLDVLRTYGKSFAAWALAVVTAVQAALSDGHVSQVEAVQIAIAAVTAVGVWLVPTHPEWQWTKTAVAVLLSVLNVLTTVIVGGLSSSDITELVLAALTVLTVGVAPAVTKTLTRRPARGY